MKTPFIGVSVVQAKPTEKDNQPGYHVLGLPGSEAKAVWVDKAEFEHYHAPMSRMPFGLAIESLRRGCSIHRTGWPAGMHLHLQVGDGQRRPLRYVSLSRVVRNRRHERLWSPTNEEMLAADWTVGTNPQPL